jgi:hypothetical protein
MTRLRLVLLALPLALTACGGAAGSSNPLLGKWRAANGACGGIDAIIFTPTTKTMHIMATQFSPATETSEEVAYNVSDKQVATLPGAGGLGQPVVWEMPDHDTMLDAFACKYVREK